MKSHHASNRLPRSIYIVLVSAFVANIIASFVILRLFA